MRSGVSITACWLGRAARCSAWESERNLGASLGPDGTYFSTQGRCSVRKEMPWGAQGGGGVEAPGSRALPGEQGVVIQHPECLPAGMVRCSCATLRHYKVCHTRHRPGWKSRDRLQHCQFLRFYSTWTHQNPTWPPGRQLVLETGLFTWKKILWGSSMCRPGWSWKAILIVLVGDGLCSADTIWLSWKLLSNRKALLGEKATWLCQPEARAFPHSCHQAGASSRCGSSPDGLFPGELPLADRATWLLDGNPPSNEGTKNAPWVRAEVRQLARLASPAHPHFLQGSSLTTRSQERPSCCKHTKNLSCY